ncbi:hypothetical protein I4U23_015476 [Adineta vaga]|nr:hypothetical protein I4U23_015476 [Adineta vaga]
MKTTMNHCHPLTYYLQYQSSHITFPIMSSELSEQIERYVLQFRTPIKYLEASLNQHMPEYLYGHLQDRIYHARQQCSVLKDDYIKTTKRLTNLLLTTNGNQLDTSTIFKEFNLDEQNNALDTSIDQLMKEISDLENAVQLDTNLELISEQDIDENETLTETDSMSEVDIHSTNLLTTDSAVDVSSSSSSSSPSSPSPLLNKPPVPRSNEVYNVLLLGESGVGKSLFINAFVNYLTYDRLDQAQSNRTTVLIPVSFTMTVGDDFKEQTVQLGNSPDDINNEDFSHPGQCVTQHCKSYVFHLDDGSKLCLIDTPGFGDTRGIDQDNLNLEHIFRYINHLTHINAICFLLKPNLSRLNIFFRSCFTQLFDFLGTDISQKLIFCFTNARSTSYAPGVLLHY